MSTNWDELITARDENRYEVHLNGSTVSKRLDEAEGALPDLLYQLSLLNYLEISDTNLSGISEQIKNLQDIIHLALHRNQITSLPKEINELDKLKFLDASFNQLNSIPFSLTMSSLQTLNLSNNSINLIEDVSSLKTLSVLHLEHNELTNLPEGIEGLSNLGELYVSNNSLEQLPLSIKELKTLRIFEASDNRLKEIPVELAQCRKLKSLDLVRNPLKDNRLRKMTQQCNAKAILDYVAKNSSSKSEGGGKGKKKGKASNNTESVDAPKLTIIQDKTDERRIVSYNNIKEVRPFICCLIIKQLDISNPDMFKKFITMQTKLHENECDMRTRATIATHRADKLQFPLHYRGIATSHLRIVPLGKEEECSASSLIERLKEEREALKLKKKRQPKTGLYRFIELVDGKEELGCLKNGDEVVISLPPITNSEITKIVDDVIDVFVEITSPVSLPDCKYVMETMLKQMVINGFISKTESGENHNGLIIEPLRVVDEEGELRCLYPSRVDLQIKGIQVERTENKM